MNPKTPPPYHRDKSAKSATAGADTYSLMPVLLPLVQAKRLMLGVPALVTFFVLMHGIFSTPYYKASTRVLPPQYNQNTISRGMIAMGGESALGNSALNLKNPTDLFVGILRSRTILDGVIEGNDLLKHYDAPDMDTARQLLESRTDINSGKDGIVEISVEDSDPSRAAKLANAYVQELQTFSSDLAKKEGGRRSDFFNNALSKARQSLNEADERLRETEKRTGFTRLRGQDEAILATARDLRSQIANKEVQLQTLLSYATDENPDVRLLRNELANLNQKVQEATRVQPPLAGQSANRSTFVPLSQAPDALMEHSQRKRDVEYWENIVTILGQYTELGKMDETRDFSLFQVLDVAINPHNKSRPRIKVNVILSGVGSTMLTVMFIWARAYVRQRRSASSKFADQLIILKDELFKNPLKRKN
jgi:tyrosine-protein kinase Etk/Wzc